MAFDGHQQRKALTALERTVTALSKGDSVAAARAAGRAADLDQIGAYAAVPTAVAVISRHLELGTAVPDSAWDELAEAVGPGPVAAAIEQLRGG